MEEETIQSIKKDTFGFFKYVFNFDEENSCAMMNMIQYAILSIIPVIIILRIVKNYVPEEDESKGSLEILAETVGQIIFIVLSIWFTNKMIRYVPTYSNCEYEDFMPTSFIIPFMIILSTIQSKLGMKINILVERVIDLWYGNNTSSEDKHEKKSNNVRVTQPISGQQQHQPSQADSRDQLLPSNLQLTQMPSQHMNKVAQPPNNQDFNQMHLNYITPLQNVNPTRILEPLAANESFGFSFGSNLE